VYTYTLIHPQNILDEPALVSEGVLIATTSANSNSEADFDIICIPDIALLELKKKVNDNLAA
jgi:hypothetical protein